MRGGTFCEEEYRQKFVLDGKPNWTLVAHLGIIGHDHVMVSMAASHYSNKGIKENGSLSINLVDEAMLAKADHAGCVSGSKEDKSKLFPWSVGESGAPILNEAPVSMACTVEDTYYTPGDAHLRIPQDRRDHRKVHELRQTMSFRP